LYQKTVENVTKVYLKNVDNKKLRSFSVLFLLMIIKFDLFFGFY